MTVKTKVKAGPSFVNPGTCDGCKGQDKTTIFHLVGE